jgi:hypothetical protein
MARSMGGGFRRRNEICQMAAAYMTASHHLPDFDHVYPPSQLNFQWQTASGQASKLFARPKQGRSPPSKRLLPT